MSDIRKANNLCRKLFTVITLVLFAAYIVYLKIKSDRIKKRKAARAKAKEEQRKRDLLEGNPYDRYTRSYNSDDKDRN